MDPVPGIAKTLAPDVSFAPAPSIPVYLARHGETESNRRRRYAGYDSEPLNAAGRGQMGGLAARLGRSGIGEIWTSEVARARESAELVAAILDVPVRTEPRLNEIRMGPWEGLTEVEVAQRFPNEHALWCTLPDRLELAGRETLGALANRVFGAITDAARAPRPVLVMSHVAPIRVAVLTALGVPLSNYKRLHVANSDAVMLDLAQNKAARVGDGGALQVDMPLFGKESSLA